MVYVVAGSNPTSTNLFTAVLNFLSKQMVIVRLKSMQFEDVSIFKATVRVFNTNRVCLVWCNF